MRPNLDAKVRHGGFAPSLWVTHCPRNEAAARVPRVKALEAVFAKSAASSILSRKHSNVLFDNVAFHRERLAGVAQRNASRHKYVHASSSWFNLRAESMPILRMRWLTK